MGRSIVNVLSAPRAQVMGLDVYAGQGKINWAEVKEAGKQFVLIKANEGEDYDDSMFVENWNGANAAGLITGAYHFFHPKDDPMVCATNFLNQLQKVGGLKPGNLPPVLDWETHEGTTKEELENALEWCDDVTALTKKHAILYSYGSYFTELGSPSWFNQYPLWLADYNPKPVVPKPWSFYSFWQYSGSGTCPGVLRPVDLDLWNGDLASLQKLCNATV